MLAAIFSICSTYSVLHSNEGAHVVNRKYGWMEIHITSDPLAAPRAIECATYLIDGGWGPSSVDLSSILAHPVPQVLHLGASP